MVKPEILLPKFRKFDEYMAVLHKLQQYEEKDFCEDPEHYGSAERFLQLAIESLNDIGNHIIASEELGEVEWYSDIPRRFYENDLIDEKMKELWIEIIGFRNVLVHDYGEIDHKRVYHMLQNDLEDLTRLKKLLAKLL